MAGAIRRWPRRRWGPIPVHQRQGNTRPACSSSPLDSGMSQPKRPACWPPKALPVPARSAAKLPPNPSAARGFPPHLARRNLHPAVRRRLADLRPARRRRLPRLPQLQACRRNRQLDRLPLNDRRLWRTRWRLGLRGNPAQSAKPRSDQPRNRRSAVAIARRPHLPPPRHLRPRPLSPRPRPRTRRAPHRQTGPGLLPRACRRHRRSRPPRHPHAVSHRAFNIYDDESAPADEVLAYAAELLGVSPPPAVAFEDANLSPMAQRFYAECKRVSNARAKAALGWRPKFPTYREGLRECLPRQR